MKKILGVVIIILLLTGVVRAASSEDLQNLFIKMDANQNGTVTQKEFTDLWEKHFTARDKSGDGELDRKEFADDKSFKSFDADGNGYIEPGEHLDTRVKHFESLDENKDGTLSLEEMLKKAAY